MRTSPPKLKICGMRDPENIMRVAELGPDYLGFIFYPPSPRFVGEYFTIPEELPSSVGRVGVFVDAGFDEIKKNIERFSLKAVQLHGNETPELCSDLRPLAEVIKVFRVDEETDFSEVKPFQGVVDYFLFDTKGKLYGGNAVKFDWAVLDRYDQRTPFFLSGGITPDDVPVIREMSQYNIAAIDINSGVEVRPAEKDVDKVRLVCDRLK
jgi:phosphoribosylanthranilate isomerase